jgi:hypothetical protein
LRNSNTITIEDFNGRILLCRDHPKQINKVKEIAELNCTLDQMELADIYRTFHPTAAEYTIFLAAHGTFSRIGHVVGHKASLDKC